MNDQELRAFCGEWAYWCHSKRYFAPPVPPNILARFQKSRTSPKEPDGPLSADMAYFNMAIHGLAEQEPDDAICFTLFYFYRFRPIKVLAAELKIGHRTFYDRMDRFARRAQKLAATIKRVHLGNLEEMRESVDLD